MIAAKEVDLRTLCEIADWDDDLPYAGNALASVHANGDVVLLHNGHELKLGTLSEARLAAVMQWCREVDEARRNEPTILI